MSQPLVDRIKLLALDIKLEQNSVELDAEP
jgi:hypothetical protein